MTLSYILIYVSHTKLPIRGYLLFQSLGKDFLKRGGGGGGSEKLHIGKKFFLLGASLSIFPKI